MTDRDTFAAAALTGLLAGPGDKDFSADYWARHAYEAADAMLRERGNHSETPNSSPTLTDEERAAIMVSQGLWALDDSPHADTLRSLLKRTKCST